MAPEVLSQKYNLECDIWSLGLVFYNILVGFTPSIRMLYGTKEEQKEMADPDFNLSFKYYPWDDVSEEAKDLIKRMIVLQPNKRYRATDIMDHEWFKQNMRTSIMSPQEVDQSVLM